jgi:hypothetical protein
MTLGLRLAALAALLFSCEQDRRDYSDTATATVSARVPSGLESSAPVGNALPSGESTVEARPPVPPLSRPEFAALVGAASEKGEYFFSDNLLSNETAYQKPANQLTQLATPGNAYIGVGPEQNFSFIGWTKPGIAFIVDIRRDNSLQQLWYKALFELAASRTEYLCLWLGRSYDPGSDPGPAATIDQVLEAARLAKKSPSGFQQAGQRIDEKLTELGLDLDAKDRRRIHAMRQTFYDQGLDLRFELHQATSHDYPTLKRMLAEQDDRATARGFLADETTFRHVQGLQRNNLVVPIVGDFAGERAMAGVAREIERRGLVVSLFYVSNVEQYLFEGDTWGRWVHNLAALPTDDRSLLARVHLDQGRPHPGQLSGHRSTMVLQRFEQFFEHQRRKPYRDAFQLVTEDLLVVPD